MNEFVNIVTSLREKGYVLFATSYKDGEGILVSIAPLDPNSGKSILNKVIPAGEVGESLMDTAVAIYQAVKELSEGV